MTHDDLVKIVGFRLGDRSDMASRVDLELDFVQDTVLEAMPWHPWFLESEAATASTVVGDRRVPLPLDFLGEVEESHLYAEADNGALLELKKLDPDVAQSKFGAIETAGYGGFPLAYAVSGLYYMIYPASDKPYPIHMRYYAKDVRMSDPAQTANSKWLRFAQDLVLAELCQVLAAKHIKDAEAAAGFAKDASEARTRLYATHTARMETNQPRSLGGNS
jgi:hypothetical protein